MNFRLFNLRVYIHPTFWLFLIFFSKLYQGITIESLIISGVLILSLLVHEYGHALTASYFGASPTIVLEGFGGRAQYNGARLTPKQHFLITLNGPLFESFLIALSYFVLKMGIFEQHAYIQYFFKVTMHLNILWCLLNLIPIAPLDGGYLVRYFLERKFGANGYKASLIIGIVSAGLVIPYLYFHDFQFFAVLILFFGVQNFQILKLTSSSMRKNSPFNSYIQGIEALKNDEIEKAKKILRKLLYSKDNTIKHSAMEAFAKIYIKQKEPEKAYELLLTADPQSLKEGKLLLCQLAFERGNYEIVAKYARDIYEIAPSYETAIFNAKAYAHLKDATMARGWLTTASQFSEESSEEVQQLLLEPLFELVREKELIHV